MVHTNVLCFTAAHLTNSCFQTVRKGISTVIADILRQYKYFLGKGTQKKSTGQGNLNVAPSSMFEPVVLMEASANDVKFDFQIAREFGEELFGIPELEKVSNDKEFQETIYKNQNVKELHKGITDGNDKVIAFKQMGFIFDIFHLRPAITFLIILDGILSEKDIEGNYEHERDVRIINDLDDVNLYQALINNPRWVPEGKYLFHHGLNEAKRIICEMNTQKRID